MARNRTLLIGVICVAMAATAVPAESNNFQCRRSDQTFCYLCDDGDLLDTCSTTCFVCTGFQCLQESTEPAAGGGDPIEELIEAPNEVLVEHLGIEFARILDNIWQGYRMPGIEKRAELRFGGAVLIGDDSGELSELQEHPLEVVIRQDEGDQVYGIRVEGHGRVDLTVSPLGGEEMEIRYVLSLDGQRGRLGNILVPHALDLPGR